MCLYYFHCPQIEETVSKEKTNTEKIIASMFDILKTNTNVCLENIILNRVSFAQTVENLFALSFLVKDGRVMITVNEKGSHYVCMSHFINYFIISYFFSIFVTYQLIFLYIFSTTKCSFCWHDVFRESGILSLRF